MTVVELQDQFVRLLARDAPAGWQSAFVHYENFLAENSELFEMSTSQVRVGGRDQHLELSLDAIDLLVALRDAMARTAASPWTWVEITVQSSGKYAFDYQYGVPPLTAQSLQRAQRGAAGDA